MSASCLHPQTQRGRSHTPTLHAASCQRAAFCPHSETTCPTRWCAPSGGSRRHAATPRKDFDVASGDEKACAALAPANWGCAKPGSETSRKGGRVSSACGNSARLRKAHAFSVRSLNPAVPARRFRAPSRNTARRRRPRADTGSSMRRHCTPRTAVCRFRHFCLRLPSPRTRGVARRGGVSY